jgi:hypothetical protein
MTAVAKNQDTCIPFNGLVNGIQVFVDGVVGNVNDFNYVWYRTDLTTTVLDGPVVGSPTDQVLDVTSYPAMAADTYFVKSIRMAGTGIGSGCESAPLRVDILDKSKDPIFTLAPFSNTACDLNFEGSLTLTVTDPGSAATPTYTYDWDQVTNPFDIEAGAGPVAGNNGDGAGPDGDNPINLQDGTYTVTITNDASGCTATGQATITKNATPIIVATANPVDQMICNADGSITVVDVTVGGVVDPAHTNFDFTWYRTDLATVIINAVNNEDAIDISNVPTISADAYFVKAKRVAGVPLGSGCESAPLRVDILDLSQAPDLAFTPTPNSSCNNLNPNATILATASERDGSTDNYTFSWLLTGGALPGVTTQNDASPTSQLTQAFDGVYTLTVTNSLSGCTFTSGLTIDLDKTISLPNIVTVLPTNPTDCKATGSARVTEISIGGITSYKEGIDNMDPPAFSYEWYASDYPTGLINGEVNHQLPNRTSGVYYVLVEDLTTNCQSTPVEVIIDDIDIIYPDLDVEQTKKQISCFVPNTGSAELLATIKSDNTATPPTYTFEWFANLDFTTPDKQLTNTTNNFDVLGSLIADEYSVTVLNNVTGCRDFAIFIVPDARPLYSPELALTTEPMLSCLSPDGSIIVRNIADYGVLDDPLDPTDIPDYPFSSFNFTAEYYTGSAPNTNVAGLPMISIPFASKPAWTETSLSDGVLYTVKITDNNTGCFRIIADTVANEQHFPTVDITLDNPLVNCALNNPNGQLSATADGAVGGYTFEWFTGTTSAGTPLLTKTSGNKLIGVSDNDSPTFEFTAKAINNTTGCAGENFAKLTDGRVAPPTPTALVVQDLTSCIVKNGWVTANVNGETFNYTFNWYDGAVLKNSSDFTGIDYFDRDSLFYTVTATDQITGCVSDGATAKVNDLRKFPKLALSSEPSYCEDTNRGGTGSLLLTVVNNTDVVLQTMDWTSVETGLPVGIGNELFNLYPGPYHVEVLTTEGCPGEGDVEIATEILAYNLVSVNNDGNNDGWVIDCIGTFENNNVKIFNRAGIMVYEANGYNNNEVIFKGIGEKGIYMTGKVLPDGTYFYIIDKRNGTKPIVGYLELVR